MLGEQGVMRGVFPRLRVTCAFGVPMLCHSGLQQDGMKQARADEFEFTRHPKRR